MNNSKKQVKIRYTLLLVILIAAGWFTTVGRQKLDNFFYPQKYTEYIYYYADKYQMDPLLICAIIQTESGFDPLARSDADALGLMQITETAFNWLRNKIAPAEEISFESLYDPETNIRFGCYYWACSLERYEGDVATAAASYFSGWTTVDDLLKNPEYSQDGVTLYAFPYDGMKRYVEKIQRNYLKYKEIYK